MNKEIAAEWTERLRSGKYAQTEGMLEHRGAFCCLGVLCTLAIDKGVITRDELYLRESFELEFDERETETLPKKVKAWAGMRDNIGRLYDDDNDHLSLAGLNDNGSTFEEIAEVIDKNVDTL